jgi:hypothetical protein
MERLALSNFSGDNGPHLQLKTLLEQNHDCALKKGRSINQQKKPTKPINPKNVNRPKNTSE